MFYSPQGKPLIENGLGRWEEEAGGLIRRKTAKGGAARSGRFAWHWVKSETLRRRRNDEVLSSSATLSFYGAAGNLLWTDEDADAPEELPPAALSDDGEVALLLERRKEGWTAVAMHFTGNRSMEIPAGSRVEAFGISPSGAFGFVEWSLFESTLTCTLVNLDERKSRDHQASLLPKGPLLIKDDGSAEVEGKTVLRAP
jgi:hypothetical protein